MAEPVKKLWPRMAVGPLGNTARVACPGDIPYGWKLEVPLPMSGDALFDGQDPPEDKPKNKGGRPRKKPVE